MNKQANKIMNSKIIMTKYWVYYITRTHKYGVCRLLCIKYIVQVQPHTDIQYIK